MKLLTHPMSIIVHIRTQKTEMLRIAAPDAVRGSRAFAGVRPATLNQASGSICPMFHFGRPRTLLQWIGHVLLGIVALLLVMWMLRVFVL